MESSRRDSLNDMDEHRPILKNNQNTYYPRFGFTPKRGMAFPKTGFCFNCVRAHGRKVKMSLSPFSLSFTVDIPKTGKI